MYWAHEAAPRLVARRPDGRAGGGRSGGRAGLLLDKNEVAAAGATTVAVDDFAMDVPQAAGGFVAVDPHITLEVSLVLLRP